VLSILVGGVEVVPSDLKSNDRSLWPPKVILARISISVL
jgi:hypothetical protein